VLNISNIDLTKDQISVLSRGLKFCPTPQALNPGECRQDLDDLHRRLRLKYCFSDLDEDGDFVPMTSEGDSNPEPFEPFKHRKFKLQSFYNPRGPPALEAMILNNELDFNKRPVQAPPRKKNLTPGEFKAITELQNLDEKITIKQADKGACVVVMNRSDYIAEANKQLANPAFYLQVEEDLTEQHNTEILDFIDKMYADGEIDISVLNYLHDTEKRTSKFYLLPKIHKGINPPPGRPIVAAIGSPTEKISKLVDHFLTPPTFLNKSFVKDTTHFLEIIQEVGPLPDNAILFTFDVTSLYTNIPNKEGIEAANEFLKT
jgi:hypothetical protein